VRARERTTTQRAVLELQARARDHDLERRLDELERRLARLHARIDGALVTVVEPAERSSRGGERPSVP
jgi:hypothetical protein